MKSNKKKFLLFLSSISTIGVFGSVVSCSAPNSSKQIDTSKEELVESSDSFPIYSNEKLIYSDNKISNDEFLTIRMQNAKLSLDDKESKYTLFARGIKTDSGKRVKYHKAISLLEERINKFLNEKYANKIQLAKPEGNKIFADESKSTGLPKEVTIGLNGQVVTLKLAGAQKHLNLGNLGKKGVSHNDQYLAQSISSIKTLYSFKYNAFLNDKLIKSLEHLNIEYSHNTPLKPMLKDLPINSDESNFKATNISFTNEKFGSRGFRATVIDVSDGDTVTVTANETKQVGTVKIDQGQSYKIRLAGIDTPEKAVGNKSGSITSPAFEYSFALHATKFAETLLGNGSKFGQDVFIGFVNGQDTYGRITADVFFGENYKYSYNTEIVRAGHSLPYKNQTWEAKFKEKDTDSYEYNVYPLIAKAFKEAIQNNKGIFNYFTNPYVASQNIYLIKNNSEWTPFYWEKTTKENTVYDYITEK
ncbi:thermonuclease family protein [Mycoplasmopsis edwardii]|uniref:Thermonuclease family protein n=1 Tax=Mycoplasmopsis edwardii TaxID=53558 RepID=A0ACD4PHX1_9BACT|nr:thermonuclease family protein [Mycoplasmopsis edwardii]WBP84256.1 thermonuclease family protein [Mycoplasmopsis edwardii]